METQHVEYIQDISFNDSCDKMAISTTSQKIIIFQKVLKKSNELIVIDKEIKAEISNKKNFKSPRNKFHRNIGFLNNTEKKKRKLKDKSNVILPSRLNSNLNDSIDLKAKHASSKSLISMEKENSKNKKRKDLKNDDDYEDSNDFYHLTRANNNSLFKSINFEGKNYLKLDRINHLYTEIDDSFDSLSNSPYFLKYPKNKEYEYRWEKITSLNIDGPALRLQWQNSEFGNIFACSGYNKCVYIIKEEKNENKSHWTCYATIKEFTDIVEDISFVPRTDIMELATITSDGFLKTFWPSNNPNIWELNHILNVSKSGCTCLCCNPSNLDQLTIVVGCKKKPYTDEIKTDKNRIKKEENREEKVKNIIKKQESIKQSNDLIKIVYFKNNNIALIGVINNNGHDDDITDVDWANQNGRLHHMICSTSKDGKFIIWEINLYPEEIDQINDNSKIKDNIYSSNFFSYKKLYEYEHNKPLWRCSFNESGILVSCVDEDGKIFVFLKTGRDKFIKLDINNQ